MPEDAAARINDAIRSCLERCYGDRTPLATVAKFLSELRRDPKCNQCERNRIGTFPRWPTHPQMLAKQKTSGYSY